MASSLWSDEERWFVPRRFGLGYSINLKYVAKRLGWIRASTADGPETHEPVEEEPRAESREERLRRQIEASKYEDKR